MEYAVRGPIVARAAEIEKELEQVQFLKSTCWSIADVPANLQEFHLAELDLFLTLSKYMYLR